MGGEPVEAGTRVPVWGHRALVEALLAAARADRLGPPLLLVGLPGVGKRTLARLVVQGLQCLADVGDRPCGACRGCRLVSSGAHPDVTLVEPPLRIDAARSLTASLALAPVEGRIKAAIIPEIDAASPGAANSLLKTLEEPPAHARLILTTSAERDVLATIRSRCRRIAVRPLAVAQATEALVEGYGIERAAAARAARLGGGSLGECLRWADPGALEARDTWLETLVAAIDADRLGRIAIAERLAKAADGLEGGLRIWLGWWRDAMLIRSDAAAGVVNVDRREDLDRLAVAYEPSELVATVRRVERALAQLAAHAVPASVVEVLILGLPRPAARLRRSAAVTR